MEPNKTRVRVKPDVFPGDPDMNRVLRQRVEFGRRTGTVEKVEGDRIMVRWDAHLGGPEMFNWWYDRDLEVIE